MNNCRWKDDLVDEELPTSILHLRPVLWSLSHNFFFFCSQRKHHRARGGEPGTLSITSLEKRLEEQHKMQANMEKRMLVLDAELDHLVFWKLRGWLQRTAPFKELFTACKMTQTWQRECLKANCKNCRISFLFQVHSSKR